jgi:hypothetical protein
MNVCMYVFIYVLMYGRTYVCMYVLTKGIYVCKYVWIISVLEFKSIAVVYGLPKHPALLAETGPSRRT